MIPPWLSEMRSRCEANLPGWFAQHPVPAQPHRSSAVLVLFGPGEDGQTRVVLTERAHHLRSHAAQVVFPGGHVDPGETAIDAALRESNEEVDLDPASVEVVDRLPGVYMSPQGTEFVPVLGWWREPHPLRVVDTDEVRRIVVPTVAELADPGRRFTATAPGGYRGPGFLVDDLIVWGVTAHLLELVLDLGGFSHPWDVAVEQTLPWRLLAPYAREF